MAGNGTRSTEWRNPAQNSNPTQLRAVARAGALNWPGSGLTIPLKMGDVGRNPFHACSASARGVAVWAAAMATNQEASENQKPVERVFATGGGGGASVCACEWVSLCVCVCFMLLPLSKPGRRRRHIHAVPWLMWLERRQFMHWPRSCNNVSLVSRRSRWSLSVNSNSSYHSNNHNSSSNNNNNSSESRSYITISQVQIGVCYRATRSRRLISSPLLLFSVGKKKPKQKIY